MGKLYIVGIGPGDYEHMTVQAVKALEESSLIVGYHVYVDLVKQWYPEKQYTTTPMTREETVALVCSGDSSIYGMAALVYELRGEENQPEIQVVPGLTAACSGGALLGAPLTHDFAVISLSDRLTPWELIEKRLLLAAQADLSMVLYNPASHGRPDHLRRACEILSRVLPQDRLCAVVRNIGREGQSRQLCTLAELPQLDVDMFCTVFVGNAMTRRIGGNMVTPRGYRDV